MGLEDVARRRASHVPDVGSGTIVVVEDHEDTLLMIVEALRAGSHEVEGFENPLEGCARLIRPPLPRLVVVDYRMPGMNGIDLVRTVRAAGIGVPVVILSAIEPWRIDRQALLELGAVQVLAKPFGVIELLDLVAARFPPERCRAGDLRSWGSDEITKRSMDLVCSGGERQS